MHYKVDKTCSNHEDAGLTLAKQQLRTPQPARQPLAQAHKVTLLAHVARQTHKLLLNAQMIGLTHYAMQFNVCTNPASADLTRELGKLLRRHSAPKQIQSTAAHLINAIRAISQSKFHTALHSMELAHVLATCGNHTALHPNELKAFHAQLANRLKENSNV
jgi:hypothetical protein